MIPQRIQLKGFLCYKDEQEIRFDDNATLWMLSGLNGSGKSSVFDAVTYALFGHHRGGSQNAAELINKESDGLVVEFDFRLDDRAYRIRRTVRRSARGASSGTQQLYRYEPGESRNGWVAVEGTNYAAEFKKWIAERIGLTYDTFTSSVLLLQGNAEKLLNSKPDGRRAVLASIVDLERYERLFEKADAERKRLKGKLEGLSDRLAALPEVKAEEVAAAEETIRGAEESREQARAIIERLRETERQARGWMEHQDKLNHARQRWQRAGQVLLNAASIERAVERLRELREVLPKLREIVKQRGTIRDAELRSRGLIQEKDKASEQLVRCDSALTQAMGKKKALQQRIELEEKQQRELAPQLLAATTELTKLKEYEQQFAELQIIQKEQAQLPADSEEEVKRARTACEELASLNQLIPQLVRFREQREGLRDAVGREGNAKQRLVEVEARGKQLGAEVKRLDPLLKAADLAVREARDRETEARTLLKQAQDSLSEIGQLHGAKRCRHCGSELTPGHLQDEKVRRQREAEQAEEKLKQASLALRSGREEEKRLQAEAEAIQKAYQEARDEFRDTQNHSNQARTDQTRLRNECVRLYGDLPAEIRPRISATIPADWLETDYPSERELEQLTGQAEGLSAARQRLYKAEATLQQWNKLKAREADKLATVQRLQGELPADRETVRRTHANLSTRSAAIEEELRDKRAQLRDADAEGQRLTRERETGQALVNGIDLQLKDKELERQHALKSILATQKTLPESWRAAAETVGSAEYNLWDKERADLETGDTEQRGRELQSARLNRELLREEVESLEAQQQGFPEEARRDPTTIKQELDQARQAELLREKDLTEAQRQLARLQAFRSDRDQIGEEYLRLEGEWSQQRTLAELLGKDRLQLYLVRQAERQVVEYANGVLDRLSGGQLYLKLSGEAEGEGAAGKALELEAFNRGTGEKPINVAFLSGSQKFRVAVSLALGIGQYASRQHRPIESVIIDEGFGCLDSQGRQVMIQELQNLRTQMRCILLVSHQEEFAEAFSDGYHFKLESGATRVERFQK
jgi:exonuclease SbcC